MPKNPDVEELARELMRRFDVLLKEFLIPQQSANFSRSETALLAFLNEHGPATMSEISQLLNLALSSTTGVVDRLVERRLVERARPESDRRTVRVMLTSRGRRALETYQADRIRLGRGMLERLAPHEREEFLDFFRKMTG
ncbi:MAG TPA: MarR family transcriptional regulator [Thermoanaerobaculia bacterium]|nr:MarR family transcriptional regulator [Thermoanaerobaculia bacterium]